MLHDSNELTDYKFYCFHGQASCVMVCRERSKGHPRYYYFDRNWKELLLAYTGGELPRELLPKPACLEEMFQIAEQLAQGIPHGRVGLYVINGRPYFGEMTFFSDSGFDTDLLPQTDKKWGDLISCQ